MDTDNHIPPLPLLPAVRPRRLTLTSSAASDEVDAARGHYGLFGRLPLEIRQQILTEAFGNRMLHMAFKRYWPPDHPPPYTTLATLPPPRTGWRGLADDLKRRVTGKGRTVPKCNECCYRFPDCGVHIKMASSVCHRPVDVVDDVRWNMWFMSDWGIWSAKRTPDMDNCMGHVTDETSDCICTQWPTERRALDCWVGVTGWLLACRQAYSDAIEILFATNGFHFSGSVLIPNLPRLVSPQRLANIQKLELTWGIIPSQAWAAERHAPFDPAKFDDKELRWICDTLPDWFPQLKELHLSLRGFVQGPGRRNTAPYEAVLAAERVILAHVESMLERIPRLYERVYNVKQQNSDDCNALSITFVCNSFWQAMLWTHDRLGMPGLKAVTDEYTIAGKFWKQLGEDGGYWVCSSGLTEHPLREMRSDLESWGFTSGDIDHIDKHWWLGLACPHETWYDASDPRKLKGNLSDEAYDKLASEGLPYR
ncbi:hypothetical protein VMCG_10315 [Cytospora schulzeri]|uniref:DUF7730 domain-containing protein n=1 Tax=Cytospora schulzeri TaxID=448051 RepID=A0A423VCD8_9PEZI|nr:hypothetical protein VMCG_10315 [Valsa malicola]